jgi:hypothetical protein
MINFGPEIVPAGHFFEMGDNRRRSRDSRMIGCIPIQDIVGKVQVVYWSRGPEQPDADPKTDPLFPIKSQNLPTRIRWERIGLRFDN